MRPRRRCCAGACSTGAGGALAAVAARRPVPSPAGEARSSTPIISGALCTRAHLVAAPPPEPIAHVLSAPANRRDMRQRRSIARMTGLYERRRPDRGTTARRSRTRKASGSAGRRSARSCARSKAPTATSTRRCSNSRGSIPRATSLEGRSGAVRQARDRPQAATITQSIETHIEVLRARRLRPEARPSQQRGVLRAQGPRPRHP